MRPSPTRACAPNPAAPQARRYDKAVALLARHAWWERLHALVRALSRDQDARPLAAAAAALAAAGQYGAAKEALLKLGDFGALADLAVRAERWEDAELMAAARPELAARVRLPRGEWLAARDRCAAGRAGGGTPGLAVRVVLGWPQAAGANSDV